MKVCIGLWNTKAWKTGDLETVLEMVRLADRKGIDAFSTPDHILKSANWDKYPYGQSSTPDINTYYYEPLTLLAAIASVTTTIRLTTNILVLPMRSAAFFAKQVATLDLLSNGRLFLGVGVGWQKEEFDATNTPWEERFAIVDEQLRVCKMLWSQSPITFKGRYGHFDAVTSRPFPLQRENIPILFGVGPTPRQFRRIAELGHGWLPDPTINQPEVLQPHLEALAEAFVAQRRDPASMQICVRLKPVKLREGDAFADLEATLAQVKGLEQAGANSLVLYPGHYSPDISDYSAWLDRVSQLRAASVTQLAN